MPTPAFQYQDPFPLSKDQTRYRLVSKEGVSVATFEGKEILKVEPSALERVANEAMRELSFFLRPDHNEQVAKILTDPEASPNDKGVALAFLRNAEISAQGELPICQDTGTATIVGKKGQQVWTGVKDEEWISKGVYRTYTEENLRYSQTAAAQHVRRGQHRHQPAGPDRPLRDRGRRVQVPLRRQGRRLRQQDHALAGDEGAPHARRSSRSSSSTR